MIVVEAHSVKHRIMKYARFERNHVAVVTEGLRNADVLGITGSRLATEFEIKVSRSDLNKEFAAIKYATMTMLEGKELAPAEEGSQQMELNIELGKPKQKTGGWTKISKHQEYINPKKYFEDHKRYMYDFNFIPNYFYMVVPDKLAAYAVSELQGTKYGVIAYDGCRGGHYGYRLDGQWYPDRDNYPKAARWVSGLPCEFSNNCIKEIAVKKKATLIHNDKISENVITAILNRAVTENIRMMGEIINLNARIKQLEGKIENEVL